jgi:hypothetical protein
MNSSRRLLLTCQEQTTNNRSRTVGCFLSIFISQNSWLFFPNLFMNINRKRTSPMMEQTKTKFLLLFFIFLSLPVVLGSNRIYELLLLRLISLTVRPGGNDCLTFSAFSFSATITK